MERKLMSLFSETMSPPPLPKSLFNNFPCHAEFFPRYVNELSTMPYGLGLCIVCDLNIISLPQVVSLLSPINWLLIMMKSTYCMKFNSVECTSLDGWVVGDGLGSLLGTVIGWGIWDSLLHESCRSPIYRIRISVIISNIFICVNNSVADFVK